MDTKQFKKLLKESITNPEKLFREVSDDTSPEAMLKVAKKQQQRAAEKEKPDGSGRAVTRWQKASPETFKRYRNALGNIRKGYDALAISRKSMDDKQWLKAFITLFNLESLGYDRKFDEQFLNFIDKSFGNKQDPLSFANFRKNMVNWNKMRVRDEGDFWKIEDSGGNILLRESLNIFLKENLGDDTKNILTYHGKIFLDAFSDYRQRLAKEKGYESAEDEEEFSKKQVSELISKIETFQKEVEDASKELTPENIITLILAVMMHREIGKKDSNNLKRNHGFFGAFVETLLTNYFNQKGSSAGKLFDLLKELLSKSIWSEKAVKIVKSLYNNKDFSLLFVLDDIINNDPRGRNSSKNIAYLKDNIADYKDSESQLNESLEKQDIRKYLESFLPFAKERLGYDKDPEIDFTSDPENGKLTLGKTAFYEPQSMKVTIFTDNRHPKDIMRSLSHELVHHAQNCDGQFDMVNDLGEGYAQNDEHLRKMEEQAYLEGNMCFRDWEDIYKQSNPILERRERLYYELMRRLK